MKPPVYKAKIYASSLTVQLNDEGKVNTVKNVQGDFYINTIEKK